MLKPLLSDLSRLLTFRLSREGFLAFDNRHLVLGLVFTWLVGMGRWWDDPEANLLQHLGLGSLVYVFALSLLLWLLVWPLKPENWSYKHVLTFVSLTSPPALLYAIPVERFTELDVARAINMYFLGIVAVWRTALLFFYLKRHARLPGLIIVIAALLPITAIILTLTIMNLERAVFDVMGGLRETGTANDEAYALLFVLSLLSSVLFIPLLLGYIAAIVHRYMKKQ